MTTTVKITTHDWPVKIEQTDAYPQREPITETFEVPPHSARDLHLTQSRSVKLTEMPKPEPKAD